MSGTVEWHQDCNVSWMVMEGHAEKATAGPSSKKRREHTLCGICSKNFFKEQVNAKTLKQEHALMAQRRMK